MWYVCTFFTPKGIFTSVRFCLENTPISPITLNIPPRRDPPYAMYSLQCLSVAFAINLPNMLHPYGAAVTLQKMSCIAGPLWFLSEMLLWHGFNSKSKFGLLTYTVCRTNSLKKQQHYNTTSMSNNIKIHLVTNPFQKRRHRKRCTSPTEVEAEIQLSKDKILPLTIYPQPVAARMLGVSLSTLKRQFYELNVCDAKQWINFFCSLDDGPINEKKLKRVNAVEYNLLHGRNIRMSEWLTQKRGKHY